MTQESILELIKKQEDSKLEFKLDSIQPQELAAEIVAFANLDGGIIVLGVSDDKKIIGVTRDDIEEWIMNICRNNCVPGIIPMFDIEEIQGKMIAKLEIPKGFIPHKTNIGKYHIRVGSTKREMTQEELARAFQKAQMVQFDETPIIQSSIQDLDLEKFNRYLQKTGQRGIQESELPTEKLLLNYGVLINYEDKIVCSVAGLLLFGQESQKFVRGSGAAAVHYKSEEVGNVVINQKKLEGDLVSIIEGLVAFVKKEMKVFYEEKTIERCEKTEYPIEAVEEAVINAAAHRDYSITGSRIRLFMFDNRLEIYSPGKLPNTITLENIKDRQFTRNQLVVKFLYDLKIIEERGEGIRKMIRLTREQDLPEPKFELLGEELRVTFYNQSENRKD